MTYGIGPPQFDEPNVQKKAWFSSIYRYVQSRTRVVVKTSDYTVDPDVYLVRVNATGGAVVITLPLAIDWFGRSIGIIKTDSSANSVTVARSGADLINGAASRVLSLAYSGITVESDGISNWSSKEALGSGINFRDNATPDGTINGTDGTDGNAAFTLPEAPSPAASLRLVKTDVGTGVEMIAGVHFNLSGLTITYTSGNKPIVGQTHRASYRY